MTLLQPIFMQHTGGDPAVDYSALELRELLSCFVRGEGILFPTSPGASGGLKVTQRGAGANFSVDVLAGRAAVLGDDVADQGMYLIRSTATENVVTPSAPGSGTRVHRLVAQVRDKFHNGSWTTYDWTPLLLEDTGSGTPATPASALNLARISIAAGQANVSDANITDDRFSAQLISGRPIIASADSGRPPNPFTSEQIFRSDKLDMEVYDGSAWRYFGLNRPYAVLNRITSNQSIPDSTTTALAWNNEIADSHGGHDNVTNNSRYTAQLAGLYDCRVTVPWALDVDGRREVHFAVNGGATVYNGDSRQSGQNTRLINNASRLIRLNAGDYVEARVFQSAVNALDVDRTINDGPTLEIFWVRP